MGFWSRLFGRKPKVSPEFQASIDQLVSIPFENQQALQDKITALKTEISGDDIVEAEKKIDAMIIKYKGLKDAGKDPTQALDMRKIYLALVALEDQYPKAHDACREIEKLIQG